MLNTMVYNFFSFEGDLAEKQPYKYKGKIMKYTALFNWPLLQFYQSAIMPGFCRLGHINYVKVCFYCVVKRFS